MTSKKVLHKFYKLLLILSSRSDPYHGGDDGRGGGDLVVGGPLRRQRDGVEEEGLQDVLAEGHVVRPLPAQDDHRGTQGVHHQVPHPRGLWGGETVVMVERPVATQSERFTTLPNIHSFMHWMMRAG